MKKFVSSIVNLSLAIAGIGAMTVDVVADYKKAKSKWLKAFIIIVDGLSLGYTLYKLVDPLVDSVKELMAGMAELSDTLSSGAKHLIDKLSKHTTNATNIDTDSADWRPRICNNVDKFRAAYPDAEISDVGIQFPDEWFE